jgi:iron complex transport system ATP-binding protein
LLDEPTASLDVNYQVGTLELVRSLVDDDGVAALAAIHDLDLAARFCDRLALLADGDVLAVGPPESVLHADSLRTAFDTDAAVLSNPITGTPTVTPLSVAAERDRRCHVLGTGQAAARVVAALYRAGFPVTVGPVPSGGVTAATAAELDVEAVCAPPFEGLADGVRQAVTAHLDAADVAVLVGDGPAVLTDLVDDHHTVVSVAADGTDSAIADSVREGTSVVTPASSDADAPDPAVVAPGDADASLVETVRRAARGAPGTDD